MDTISRNHTFAKPAAGHRTGSRRALWAGRLLSAFAALFLLVDAVGKLLELQPVVDGSVSLGYPPGTVFGLGVTLLTCVALYVHPRTSVLGAVLLTGYLGGAVATHVRVGHPLPSHTLFPVYVAAFVWGGLVLRDPRLRAVLPFIGDDAAGPTDWRKP